MKTLTEVISDYRNALIEHKVSLFREQLVLKLVKTEMERKPLTIGQLFGLYNEHAKCQQEDWLVSGWLAFAAAIERAHGIGGEE